MRYVFMDEAGTSANEPVTVVVGLVAHADDHVMAAEALALEALGAIPPAHQHGFVFHATAVYGDRKYQKDWSLTDRLKLLHSMMSIPRRIGMAIALGVQWRNASEWPEPHFGLSGAQIDHMMAFGDCVKIADRYIRDHTGPREVASIVAEDVPEMRKFLKQIPRLWRDNPYYIPPDGLRRTASDIEAGYLKQSGDMRVTRIRNSVHFVEKSEDPLVQVADACAYGVRRYFAGEKFGLEFVNSIFGSDKSLADFASPAGATCVRFEKIIPNP